MFMQVGNLAFVPPGGDSALIDALEVVAIPLKAALHHEAQWSHDISDAEIDKVDPDKIFFFLHLISSSTDLR